MVQLLLPLLLLLLMLLLLLLLLSLHCQSLLVLDLLQGRHVGHCGLVRSPGGGQPLSGPPRLRLQSRHPLGVRVDVAQCRCELGGVSHPPFGSAASEAREAHATFQLKRFAESKVLGDRNFDMLGENFGRDHGWRAMWDNATCSIVFGHGRWCGAAGGCLQRTRFANSCPRSFG